MGEVARTRLPAVRALLGWRVPRSAVSNRFGMVDRDASLVSVAAAGLACE